VSVHFLPNALAQVAKGSSEMVAAAIRTIFAQPKPDMVRDQHGVIATMLGRQSTRVETAEPPANRVAPPAGRDPGDRRTSHAVEPGPVELRDARFSPCSQSDCPVVALRNGTKAGRVRATGRFIVGGRAPKSGTAASATTLSVIEPTRPGMITTTTSRNSAFGRGANPPPS
jgi:hypothetical protein